MRLINGEQRNTETALRSGWCLKASSLSRRQLLGPSGPVRRAAISITAVATPQSLSARLGSRLWFTRGSWKQSTQTVAGVGLSRLCHWALRGVNQGGIIPIGG